MLVLNLALVAGLVVVGLTAHSVGVLAEGGDDLADAAAVGIAMLAMWLGSRPPTPRHPHGYPRATAVAALINSAWLLAFCAVIAAGAFDRLIRGTTQVHGLPVLVVSGVAAIVMFFGALVLHGDAGGDGDDLHVRAVLLDTAADGAAAGGVAMAGGIILVTGGTYWLDPAVALIVAAAVGYETVRLLRQVGTSFRTE